MAQLSNFYFSSHLIVIMTMKEHRDGPPMLMNMYGYAQVIYWPYGYFLFGVASFMSLPKVTSECDRRSVTIFTTVNKARHRFLTYCVHLLILTCWSGSCHVTHTPKVMHGLKRSI